MRRSAAKLFLLLPGCPRDRPVGSYPGSSDLSSPCLAHCSHRLPLHASSARNLCGQLPCYPIDATASNLGSPGAPAGPSCPYISPLCSWRRTLGHARVPGHCLASQAACAAYHLALTCRLACLQGGASASCLCSHDSGASTPAFGSDSIGWTASRDWRPSSPTSRALGCSSSGRRSSSQCC